MDSIIKVVAIGLEKKDINIGDNAFARSAVVKKMEFSAAVDHYTREERNALREMFELMDAADGATASVGEALMEAAEGATSRVGDGEEAVM